MMDKTIGRTRHIARNASVTIIVQAIILIVSFINRTVFIYLLGLEYLGIDGIFASILTVFSLAELGIGNAIIYNLYKPIAEGDNYKARQYLTLYDKAYRVIILVITIVGIILLPFIKSIVNADKLSVDINLYIIFVLFLLNTVSTYFLAHKQAVFVVNQRQSTVSIIQMIIKVIASIGELIILLITRNYYLFLVIKVLFNYVQAIIIYFLANKKYPELSKKNNDKIDESELNEIRKNVGALAIRRVGSVVLSSTDNLIINSFISTVMVGIYSNYVLIVSSIQTITVQLFASMTASIGNYVATNDAKEVKKVFDIYSFAIFLVYGFCSVCLFNLSNRFIILLWGKKYLIDEYTLLVIVINFFMYGFQTAINVFRDTTGLFVQGKYRAIFSALVNVIFSIVLVKSLGLCGVILATIISRVFVSAWYDPYILYKNFFKSSVKKYYMKFMLYFSWFLVVSLGVKKITDTISRSLMGFIVCGLISAVMGFALVIPFLWSSEWKGLFSYFKAVILKRKTR